MRAKFVINYQCFPDCVIHFTRTICLLNNACDNPKTFCFLSLLNHLVYLVGGKASCSFGSEKPIQWVYII